MIRRYFVSFDEKDKDIHSQRVSDVFSTLLRNYLKKSKIKGSKEFQVIFLDKNS